MSARKYGEVVVSIRGERSKPVRLDVSWTTRAELNRAVETAVGKWAKSVRKWWGVYVDITTLETDEGGKIFINDDHSTFVAQFRVELQSLSVPTPVPALFAVGAR